MLKLFSLIFFHSFSFYVTVVVPCLTTQSCPTLCNAMDCTPPSSSVHGDSPGKNTEVGRHAFPTQGSNPCLPHCRQILYHLSHQGSPGILECVDYPFSRGPSQPRNQTRVSCITGIFFTNYEGSPSSTYSTVT